MTESVQFTTVVQQLEWTAGECDKTATSLDGNLAALRTYVSGLAEAWLGKASQQYTLLMAEFDHNSRNLTFALREIAGGLRNNEANYTQGETTNTTVITNLLPELPSIKL